MADKENLKYLEKLNELQKTLNSAISSSLDINNKILLIEQSIANQKLIQSEQERILGESKSNNLQLTEEEKKALDNIQKTQANINTELKKESTARKILAGTLNTYNTALKSGWQYLMQSDKVIKSTILNLGLSGAKANEMRLSFEQSAGLMARLGGSIEDIGQIQEAYTEETGRATALSADMLKNITLIGKGTGLGVQQASKLVGQFNSMGVSAKAAMDYVQGVVDTSERMGVNSTKVLKNVSDNFKKLNTYNFQQGSKGFAQMAMYAEKLKINMTDALNAADIAKSLEGAIDLTAQLQVMGGEFAKTDPFEMLFLSRNDPAKFTEKIGDMTKGLVTFRKTADGSFEKFISPADRDRIAAVAKSMGMEAGALTEIAQKQADIQRSREQMAGLGLSDEQKSLIENSAQLNKENGRYEVLLAGKMVDISKLTKDQAKAFTLESVSLEKRAEESQTFEEVLKATMMELKSTLLPLLQHVNKALTWVRETIKPLMEGLTSGPAAWAKVIGTFAGAVLLWKTANGIFSKGVEKLSSGITNKVFGGASKAVSNTPIQKGVSGLQDTAAKGGGGGGKAFGKGAGIGAAAVGIGAGIGIAAVGISKLADSMSKLSPEQAKALQNIAMTLAITFPLAAIGIAIVSAVAAPAAPILLALGAALLMMGGAIFLAATGIGNMSEGLSKLIESGAKAGTSLFVLAGGMAAIAGSLMLFTAGSLGLIIFGSTMAMIALTAPAITKVGAAFKEMNLAMVGNKEDYQAVAEAINSIANANIKGGGMLADLSRLMKTPLKVEFADKGVAIASNIVLNVDGHKLAEQIKILQYATTKAKEVTTGQSGDG